MQVFLCRGLRFFQKFFSDCFSYEYSLYDIPVGHTTASPSLLSCVCLHYNLFNAQVLSFCKFSFSAESYTLTGVEAQVFNVCVYEVMLSRESDFCSSLAYYYSFSVRLGIQLCTLVCWAGLFMNCLVSSRFVPLYTFDMVWHVKPSTLWCADMKFSFFLFCVYVGVSLLSPVMHNLWIWRVWTFTFREKFHVVIIIIFCCFVFVDNDFLKHAGHGKCKFLLCDSNGLCVFAGLLFLHINLEESDILNKSFYRGKISLPFSYSWFTRSYYYM